MSTTTPPDVRPATVHGGDALDWWQAYMQLRQSWEQLKGCGAAGDVYWPARRQPIVRPVEEPA